MAEDALVSVNIKWSKETLPPVQIDTNETPAVFKTQLWTLTGVPPDRQTVIGFKGGKLKDDADWSKVGLRQGMKIVLLGTPDESRLPPPKDLPTVRDDLDMDSVDASNEPPPTGPPGLVNLGNTCYMNATVQCLQAVSPLTSALYKYRGSTTAFNPAEKLSASLRDTFSRLKSRNTANVNPMAFLTCLRQVNPQFAERNEHGFMQQDAEECLVELLSRLSTALVLPDEQGNFVDSLFSYNMHSVDRCEETDEVVERNESVRALKCHISSKVNYLANGVLEGLEETIDKTSEKLERSAQWKRTSRMGSLPPYLIVQFVRFYWKAAESVKAKIMRRVEFPVDLDVYDFCTEPLQKQLSVKRDAALAASSNEASADKSEGPSGSNPDEPAEAKGSDVDISGLAPSDTGNYELQAVLTHKGRATDSGHYVAWVRDSGTRWFLFDDDKVSVHTEEDVKKLCGGGDWHMAYMCLYRAKNHA